ncbi:oligosaccharide flippase family protein [Cellulophaga sp. Z1A5H]|uniref:oligosaccharide flippase family protein n=1 Tax=Cellulophaga sp. Z1A5H TaxID=2687291 RepID=UPI0013FE076A|nr:oligosaccharide flippase family protein [Cellulophaga sp. Z1A5H]
MLNSLKEKITRNELLNDSFWAVFGNIFGKGLSLLSVILIARILGKDLYGEYGVIINTVISLTILGSFGLSYTSTKFVAELNRKDPTLLYAIINNIQKITIYFTLSLSIGCFFLSEIIAVDLLKEPKLSFLLKISTLYIVFNGLSRTQIGILAGLKQFKNLAKINGIIGVSSIILSVFLSYYFSIIGAIIAIILIQALNCFLNYRLIKKNIIKNKIKRTINTKEILKFSFPVALQEAVYAILTWCFSLILVRYSNIGEVGLYSAAAYWSALILFIPGILRNVILSHMSTNLDDEKKHNNILKTVLLINFTITFIISIIIYFSSDYIIKIYGENFVQLKNVLNISVFTTIFVSISNVYAQAYMSKNKNWTMLIFRLIRDSSILLISYYLININNGANGALHLAKSAFISNIIFFFLMAIFYEFYVKNEKEI